LDINKYLHLLHPIVSITISSANHSDRTRVDFSYGLSNNIFNGRILI